MVLCGVYIRTASQKVSKNLLHNVHSEVTLLKWLINFLGSTLLNVTMGSSWAIATSAQYLYKAPVFGNVMNIFIHNPYHSFITSGVAIGIFHSCWSKHAWLLIHWFCVIGAPWVMVLPVLIKRVLFYKEGNRLAAPSQHWEMMESRNVYFFLSNNLQETVVAISSNC